MLISGITGARNEVLYEEEQMQLIRKSDPTLSELEKIKKDVLVESFHQIQMPNFNMSKEGILILGVLSAIL